VKTVFPNAVWLLCIFHVKQAWNRVIVAGAYGVGGNGSKIAVEAAQQSLYNMLEAIEKAENAEARNDALCDLTDSRIYQENNRVRSWFDNTWLPCWDEWTKVGRANVFNRGINTNNPLEALNKYDIIPELLYPILNTPLNKNGGYNFERGFSHPLFFWPKHQICVIMDEFADCGETECVQCAHCHPIHRI